MRKLILRNGQSPGDIVMLTAAVRDLHSTYPGQFQTDVRTACPELWENNPYVTALSDDDPEVAADRLRIPADPPEQRGALSFHSRLHRAPE